MPLTQVSSRAIEDTLRYVLGASGTDHYTFTGKGLTGAVNDPTLTLSRGHTYIFENRSGGHPFYIKTSIANGGTNDAYNTGVTNNGGGNGTEIVFTVPHDAPDTLYYQCSSHSSMAGQLNIAGSVADGSITTAKLADQAVDLSKLPHGDTNNDGKFLRANNGADPSFESLPASGISNVVEDTTPQLGGDLDSNGNNVKITDGEELRLGDSNDCVLKHTGSTNQILSESHRLIISGASDNNVDIMHTQSEYMASFIPNAAVELFHNNTKQCETSANGLAFPSGKGIDFSATANAALHAPDSIRQTGQGYDPSTDSEVLTHYEHGTWTPRLRAYDHTNNAGWGHMVYTDGTVVEGTGRYIRIGRLVWAGYQISTGTKVFDSGWTYWSIDTIPFGANHYDGRSGGNYVFQTNAFTDTTNIIGGNVNGADAYLVGNRPSGEYNATINTSNNSRVIRGYALFYTSTG